MRAFRLSEDGLAAVLVVVLLVLQACVIVVDADDDDDFDPDDLERNDWVLETMVIDGRSYTIRSGVYVLVFEHGGLGGEADCNVYGGDYRASRNGALTISGLYSTEIACEPPSFEQDYFSNLLDVASYEIRRDDLYLYNRRGDLLLRFRED